MTEAYMMFMSWNIDSRESLPCHLTGLYKAEYKK